MKNLSKDELESAKKALACLVVQVPGEVYDDVMKKLRPVIAFAEEQINTQKVG